MIGSDLQELGFGAVGYVTPNCVRSGIEIAPLLSGSSEDLLKPARVRPFAWWWRIQKMTFRIPMDLHCLTIDVGKRIEFRNDAQLTCYVDCDLCDFVSTHL